MLSNGLVVITGCDGFIGRGLISELSEESDILGIDVAIKNKHIRDNLKFLELDILNLRHLSEVKGCIENFQDIYIVHLVGMSDANQCQRNKEAAYNLNVKSLLNVCKIFQEYRLKRIIFPSTALVYGMKYQGLIDEDFLPKPENVYAETKLEAENVLAGFSRKNRISGTILRLSNVYGSGMNSDTLIPTVLRQLKSSCLNLKEYKSIRDYLYIKDAIRALRLCLSLQSEFNIYNVGTSVGYSVHDLIKIIAGVLGKKESVPEFKTDTNVADKLVLSHNRIKKDLRWEPSHSLEDGIRDMIAGSK